MTVPKYYAINIFLSNLKYRLFSIKYGLERFILVIIIYKVEKSVTFLRDLSYGNSKLLDRISLG